MSDQKARYSDFCQQGYVPIHHQPWWLDACCGPQGWGAALAGAVSGATTGILPYGTRRRWGLKVLHLPPFSAYAGPWLRYPESALQSARARLSFEKKTMSELIDDLPHAAFFRQNFRPEINNWLPFYWAGFRQTTRYTYILPVQTSWETTTRMFKNTLRTDLKKADYYTVILQDNADWRTVFTLNRRSYERKGLRPPYPAERFERLHEALYSRAQSLCFLALDRATGRPSAGLYLVFDDRGASVLFTGTEPALKYQCGVYGLWREAIHFCRERALPLDFEGSMDAQIERSFRAFGATLTPYFQVWKWGI